MKVRALRERPKLNKGRYIKSDKWVEGDVLDIPSLEEAMKDIMSLSLANMVSFNPSKRAPCMKSTSKVLLTLLMSL